MFTRGPIQPVILLGSLHSGLPSFFSILEQFIINVWGKTGDGRNNGHIFLIFKIAVFVVYA